MRHKRQSPAALERERLRKASAFPLAFGSGGEYRIGDHGLSKRELFAAMFLQGLLSSAPLCDRTKVKKTTWARVAIEFADALLEELR